MAINPYFQSGKGIGTRSEQELVEQQIIELIQLAGMDFHYIPRNLVNEDKILNEDPLASFEKNYKIEMYCENVSQFAGSGNLFSKFGLELNDTMELTVAKKRFVEETNMTFPLEGDLIYWALTNSLWQIDFVGSEQQIPFYKLSNLYTFQLKCSRYTFSYEDFDSGITNIDDTLVDDLQTPFEKNDIINDTANDYISFDETNPFGEISEEDSN